MIHRPFLERMERGAARVRLPGYLVSPLHIRPGDCLYSVILDPSIDEQPVSLRPAGPFTTVYASPLPYAAWDRLIKARFTTGPGPGTTFALCQTLKEAELYARSFQTSEHHSFTRGPVQVPDTEVVFEVPGRKYSDQPHSVRQENQALHHLLDELLKWRPQRTGDLQATTKKCIDTLSRVVRARDPKYSVDQVTPLAALNALVNDKQFKPAKLMLEPHDENKDDVWLPCQQWHRTFWPESRSRTEGARHPDVSPIVMLSSVNVDEKLLTLHFFKPQTFVLAAFDLVVPSAGLEQRWWEWVYEEIKKCNGSVLSSYSTARHQGRWSKLSVVAAYPSARCSAWQEGEPPPPDDVGQVVESFRNLKGGSTRSPAYLALVHDIGETAVAAADENTVLEKKGSGWMRIRVARQLLADRAIGQLAQPPRLDSTLENIRLWCSSPAPTEAYSARFGRNRFSFTRPLGLKEYGELYNLPDMKKKDSRAALADQLAKQLCSEHSENAVLVGAYRSGKTTVMNIVVDLITNQEDKQFEDVIAVRVNAAVTPPEQLFLAVYQEIHTQEGQKKKSIVDSVKKAAEWITTSFKEVLAANASLEVGFALPFIKTLTIATQDAGKAGQTLKDYENDLKQHGGLEPLVDLETPARRAAKLRASVTLLKLLLKKAKDKAKENGKQLRVVIALDEVGDTKAWGSKWAFPAWRALIEDPELREARWLFSSTRPLSLATGYSPLGNAMREHNMEPLHDVEAEALLDAFENTSEKWWDPSLQKAARLRPVLTHHARKRILWLTGKQPYLLQVVSAHLFEGCANSPVPILTSRVVRDIVNRRILPELSDFFLSQWKTLDPVHASEITETVTKSAARFNPWHYCPDDRTMRFGCSPEVQKSLERAGLGSQTLPLLLVPMFVMWLLRHSRQT